MQRRRARFFLGLTDPADPEADPLETLVDVCFDLAKAFSQHPDAFLSMPIEDIPFYAEAASRLAARMKG